METSRNGEHQIIGVFKGGGAKGVLYAGACEALAERSITFSQVAGSSAGAITAALLAAGAGPDHLRELEVEGRAVLSMPSAATGARNLHNSGGVLSFDALMAWLAASLTALYETQLGGGPVGEAGPTFAELAASGGLPLHIACADIRWRSPVVFNADLTPHLPVARAAAVSSAIPVIFELPWLCDPEHGGFIPAIDGGVMANLPLFVFTDPDYRAMAGLHDVVEHRVVGFTLVGDESPSHTSAAGETGDRYRGRYAQVDDVTTFSAGIRPKLRQRGQDSWARRYENRSGKGGRLAAVVSAPLNLIDLLLRVIEIVLLVPLNQVLKWTRHSTQRTGEITANGKRAKRWAEFANGAFDLAPGYLLVGLVLLVPVIVFGLPNVAVALWPDWPSFFDENNVFQGAWMVLVVGLVWVALMVGLVLVVVVIILGLATYIVGWILKPALGEVGPSFVATFMRNPQEPAWTGAGANQLLIRIEVPSGWTLLRATDDAEELADELSRVKASVHRQLEDANLGHPPR